MEFAPSTLLLSCLLVAKCNAKSNNLEICQGQLQMYGARVRSFWMTNNMKQLQCKLIERCPLRNAIIRSNLQLSSISSHFTERHSGPLCSTRLFLLCPFLLTCPTWLPPAHPTNPCCATAVLHVFWKNAHFLACPLCSVSVADYGLVADLFKVHHFFANWLFLWYFVK